MPRNSFRPGNMVMVVEDHFPPEGTSRVGAIGIVRTARKTNLPASLNIDVRFTASQCLWFSACELHRIGPVPTIDGWEDEKEGPWEGWTEFRKPAL